MYLPSELLALLLLSAQSIVAVVGVSTIVVTATSPAIPTSTSFTNDADFENAMLAAHDFYRSEHNASALTWNTTSATYATSWASNCNFKHSGGPTGENLAAGYANASASVDAWGLEREGYNWGNPGFSETTGHFTQLVWRNTTSVGCGKKSCGGTNGTPGFYVVCEYYPPGNIVGDSDQYFKDNVLKQIKGKVTDTVESGVTSSAAGLGVWRGEGRWTIGMGLGAMGVGWAVRW